MMTAQQLREEILFREIWLRDLAEIHTWESSRMRGVLRLEIDSMKRALERITNPGLLGVISRASAELETIVDL